VNTMSDAVPNLPTPNEPAPTPPAANPRTGGTGAKTAATHGIKAALSVNGTVKDRTKAGAKTATTVAAGAALDKVKTPNATTHALKTALAADGTVKDRTKAGVKTAATIGVSKAAGAATTAATGGNVAAGRAVDVAVNVVMNDPKKAMKVVVVSVSVLMVALISVPLIMAATTMALVGAVTAAKTQYDNATPATRCDTTILPDTTNTAGTYDDTQHTIVATIVDETVAANLPTYAAVILTSIAITNSGLTNLDGTNNQYGIFAQTPDSGWGTGTDLTNITLAIQGLLGVGTHTTNTGLTGVSSWETTPLSTVAQQLLPTTDGYGGWEMDANVLVSQVTGTWEMFQCFTTGAPGDSNVWGSPLPVGSWTFTSPFNPARVHPIYGYPRPHNGVDLAAPTGTPIFAVASGTVEVKPCTECGVGGGGGNQVWVTLDSSGYQMRYLHMSAFAVSTGTHVTQGQLLGFVGATGDATGPHLHFEIIVGGVAVNPEPLLQAKGVQVR